MDKLTNHQTEHTLKNRCATNELENCLLKNTEVEDNSSNTKKVENGGDSCKLITNDDQRENKYQNNQENQTSNLKIEETFKNCEDSTKKDLLNICKNPSDNFQSPSDQLALKATLNTDKEVVTNKDGGETSTVSRILDKETLLKRFARHRSWQDFFESRKSKDDTIDEHFQRNRSNSDGAAVIKNNNHADAFPSLPNSVLEEMGLHGDPQKERTAEIQETEQKFTTLSLAFAIDAATIKDRCERQRRTRDQTENNLIQEINKLKDKLAFLQPLCTDFESAELLSILLSQVERISRAASEVSTAAERYGAVQHEERLTESVRLMVNYVQALKQQRDSARRQLQCTKKVLQEKPSDPNLGSSATTQKMFQISNNRKVLTRRASIATTNQSSETNPLNKEVYLSKLSRRTSDLSFRASFLNKSTRPNRLELGGELLKIREDFCNENIITQNGSNSAENNTPPTPPSILRKNSSSTAEDILGLKTSPSIVFRKTSSLGQLLKKKSNENLEEITEESGSYQMIREKFRLFIKDVRKKLKDRFKNWSENDYLQAFFNFCAILCFSVSIVTLVKMYIEYQYSKRGADFSSYFSWFWSSSPQKSANNVGSKLRKKI